MTAIFCALAALLIQAESSTIKKSPRALVHLLEYLAADYGGAVHKGKVVNQLEYDEQVEFAKLAAGLVSALPSGQDQEEIRPQIQELEKLIVGKADAQKVSDLATSIKLSVMQRVGIPTSPKTWPSLKAGRHLFEVHCTICHGNEGKGDGPAGAGLDPLPANFFDADLMEGVSPFRAFNVIRVGIPGTGMIGYQGLSDQEIWDLAFYVTSIRHSGRVTTRPLGRPFDLGLVASQSDAELKALKPDKGLDAETWLAIVRTYEEDRSGIGSLQFARDELGKSLQAYEAENFDAAKSHAIAAYLEGIEPIEAKLRAGNDDILQLIETEMMAVRSVISLKRPLREVHATFDKAYKAIDQVEEVLSTQVSSEWLTFVLTAGILLREGLEALLILIVILGVVRAVGAKRTKRYVHAGWIAALVLGIVAWFASGWMVTISGASRELTEGIAAILAVLVLLYMGFWLHSRTEIGRWNRFIEGKVKKSLEGGASRWGLFGLAFMAVFREAFETVLFLRAISLDGGESSWALGLGVVVVLVAIIVFGWLILKLSIRLPLRTLFSVSALLMTLLAVILMGKGVYALQEAGYFPATLIGGGWNWELFGIYPTWQSIAAQLATVAVAVVLWLYGSRAVRCEPQPPC